MAEVLAQKALAASMFSKMRNILLKDLTPSDDLSTQEQLEEYIGALAGLAAAVNNEFQHELAGARRRRNAMLSMHRLPSEILTEIFLFTMGPLEIRVEQLLNPKRQRGALELVCGTWKTTVRASASLWVFVSCYMSTPMNKISLKRSKNLLLTCRGGVGVLGDYFWRTMKPHTSRIGTVSAEATDPIISLLQDGLKNLQQLRLDPSQHARNSNNVLTSSLDEPWPRLRHLYLHSISLPWPSPLVSNLVVLSLVHVKDLTPYVLAGVLRNSPQLEELDLRGLRTPTETSSVWPFPKPSVVCLPSLRDVKLHFPGGEGEFFNYILNTIEPKRLEKLDVVHRTSPGGFKISAMPKWAIDQGGRLLMSGNRRISLQSSGWVSGPGFSIKVLVRPSISWAADILDQLREFASPIQVECINFRLNSLNRYLPHQLNRCELILKHSRDPKCMEAISYLCQRLPDGSFPFPMLVELSVHFQDEESMNSVIGLLGQRYCSPTQISPLRKLEYTTSTRLVTEDFETRISAALGGCVVQLEPPRSPSALRRDFDTDYSDASGDW